MESENKVCQNCKLQFIIEPADFDFYRKINVPPPTFCPQCRFQRRLAFFNLRTLYKRICDLCKQEKLSMYPPESPYTIYCAECWWSDRWDPFTYGREYDFSKPFFEQFNELWHVVPLLGLSIGLETAEAAPYNNHAAYLKNCYLLFNAEHNEDCAYGSTVIRSQRVFDCSALELCERSYDCRNAFKNSGCIGTINTIESINCAFTRDCVNCQNCFASANLRSKKYYIFNQPHTKEEYFEKIKKWDLGSYKTYEEIKRLAKEHWKQFPPKPRFDDHSVNVTGNYAFHSKNCKDCFEVGYAENCAYVFWTPFGGTKDSYDITCWGNNMELSYECCIVGEDTSRIKFCQESGISLYDAEYSKLSTGGSHHFGCVSMKKGNYCILNKRYSKDEYDDLRSRIIQHMNEMPYTSVAGHTYRYGEFFPPELSPFSRNTTLAQDFFPRTKEETNSMGLRWREPDRHKYHITRQANELPDHIKDAPQNVLKETLGCISCGKGFRIIQMEFDFLKSMNLPLPHECPFCRINSKFNEWIGNFRTLQRMCSKCGIKFETNYPEADAVNILCKKCYLAEVV